jgi:hypothetical protein
MIKWQRRIGFGALTFIVIAVVAVAGMEQYPSQRASDAQSTPPGYIDGAARGRVIDAIAVALKEAYVDPDLAKKMEVNLRARLSKGEFNNITDGPAFALALTDALRSVSHDKHLGVDFFSDKLPPFGPPSPEQLAQRRAEMQASHCGFEPAQRLSSKVALLKFNAFPPVDACKEAASAALNSLGSADAIIFDLRDNGGGDPAMVTYIASYLFSTRIHLTDIWWRKTGVTDKFWTKPDAPGQHYSNQPIFILTSGRTFSGAEDFSYSLKALQRAIVVGETTGGGAHPTEAQPVGDKFMIRVPTGKTINPVTQANWEGVGVEPNVKVDASKALETAQKLATQVIERK